MVIKVIGCRASGARGLVGGRGKGVGRWDRYSGWFGRWLRWLVGLALLIGSNYLFHFMHTNANDQKHKTAETGLMFLVEEEI